MSATRLIIRLFLVAILIGMGVVVFAAWRNSKPEYLLSRAQSALDDGDANSARLQLQNMVERFPENSEGHRLLAQAWLKEAAAEQKPATYFRHPQAFASLVKAAELAPENIELQKEVLEVFIRSAQPLKGIKFAENILKKNPDDVDAQFVKVVQGVGSRSSAVVAQLDKLQTQDKSRQFQLLLLELDYYNRVNKKDEQQQVLTKASNAVAAVTAEQINTMPRLESDAMTRLIRAAVSKAPDASTALLRTEQAVGTLTKFPLDEKAVLADVTQITTELMLGLQHAYPAAADTPEQKQARARLQQAADDLRGKTLAANVATPLVFHQAALHTFTSGDHEKAAATIKEGLATAEKQPSAKPEDTLELHLLAARNYLIMRKHREAQPHLDQLLAAKDSRYSGWGELLSGAVNAAEGRYEKAYQHFTSAERKLGTVLFVHMGLANSCLALGKWEEALPHLQALHQSFESADVELRAWAAQNDISRANVHFGQFRAYLALNRWEDAQKQLGELAGTPLAGRASAMAIAYLWGQGKRDETLKMLADARKQEPNNLALLQMEAGFRNQLGQTAEATKLLEDAAAAEPSNLQLQLLLVRWKLSQKQTQEALDQLTKLQTDFPQEAAPALLKAYTLIATNKVDEAIEIAKSLKSRPEAQAAANFLIAAAEMRKNNPEAAATELAEAEARTPDHGLIKLLQGEVSASQGDYAGAIANVGSSLDVVPLRLQARTMLLRSLLLLAAKEGPAAAEAQLQPLVEEHPDDAFLQIALADFKFKQGRFDEAMKLLDRAEQLSPGSADVPYIKAGIWLQRGRADLAYQECKRGLAIAPKHLASLALGADLAARLGLHQDSLAYAKTALEAMPNAPAVILMQAGALANLRRSAEAETVLRDAIKAQPMVNMYYDRLAALQAEAKQNDAALATIRQGRKGLPADLMLASAEVSLLCRLNKLDEAKAFAAEFTKDQTAPDRLLTVAQAFFREGQYDLARDWGGQALAIAEDKVKPAIHLMLGDVNLVEYETTVPKNKELVAQARDHFAAVLAVAPEHYIAGNNLAWILATEFNDAAKAAEVIDRVRGKATVEQMPINFIDTLAVVYRQANRLEDAQQVLERATAMYQENPLLLYQLALVQSDRKLYAASRNSLERAIQLGVPEKYQQPAQQLLDSLRTHTETNTSTAVP